MDILRVLRKRRGIQTSLVGVGTVLEQHGHQTKVAILSCDVPGNYSSLIYRKTWWLSHLPPSINGWYGWFIVENTMKIWMMTRKYWLVVFRPTPLKNDGVSNSWDDDIPFPLWWETWGLHRLPEWVIVAGWWCNVTCFHHLEKYEFVTGKDDIPYIMENDKCLKPATSFIWSGWWYTYPSEKWWSSSVGMFWNSQYIRKVIKFMFQTSNQVSIGSSAVGWYDNSPESWRPVAAWWVP